MAQHAGRAPNREPGGVTGRANLHPESPIPELSGSRAVLVASTGGHLAQLVQLVTRLDLHEDPLWITFEHPQSLSLVRGSRVAYVPYVASRDYVGLARVMPRVRSILRQEDFDVCVSTGAAIALAALPQSRLMGKEAHYIESVSRFDGPSLSGRLLSHLPGINLYTQHAAWADKNWSFRFSILQSYEPRAVKPSWIPDRPKVFVTLGTIRPFRFDALVDRLLSVLPPQAEVMWQLGETVREHLPGTIIRTMPTEEFDRLVTDSDVVVSHSGVGSTLRILELGKSPVLVPRRAARGEHVDDHQAQIADRLSALGLVTKAEVPELTMEHLLAAHSTSIDASPQNKISSKTKDE